MRRFIRKTDRQLPRSAHQRWPHTVTWRLAECAGAVTYPATWAGCGTRWACQVAVSATLAGAQTFAVIADWLDDLDEPARARLGFTYGARRDHGAAVADQPGTPVYLRGCSPRWLRQRPASVLPGPARQRRTCRIVIDLDGAASFAFQPPVPSADSVHWVDCDPIRQSEDWECVARDSTTASSAAFHRRLEAAGHCRATFSAGTRAGSSRLAIDL